MCVCSIRLLLALGDDFIEDFTRRACLFSLCARNPTDDARRDCIFICSVPVTGIALGSALARQFFLGYREFVGLPGLDDEFALFLFPDADGNRAAKVPVLQTLNDDLHEARNRFTELRPAGLPGVDVAWVVRHCDVALSCL